MTNHYCNDSFVKYSDKFYIPIEFGDEDAVKIAELIESTLAVCGYSHLRVQWINIISADNPNQCSGNFVIADMQKHPDLLNV